MQIKSNVSIFAIYIFWEESRGSGFREGERCECVSVWWLREEKNREWHILQEDVKKPFSVLLQSIISFPLWSDHSVQDVKVHVGGAGDENWGEKMRMIMSYIQLCTE